MSIQWGATIQNGYGSKELPLILKKCWVLKSKETHVTEKKNPQWWRSWTVMICLCILQMYVIEHEFFSLYFFLLNETTVKCLESSIKKWWWRNDDVVTGLHHGNTVRKHTDSRWPLTTDTVHTVNPSGHGLMETNHCSHTDVRTVKEWGGRFFLSMLPPSTNVNADCLIQEPDGGVSESLLVGVV